MNYFPLTLPFYLGIVAIITFLVVLVELDVLTLTFQKLGVNPRWVFLFLLSSLLGSAINIPVARIPERQVVSDQIVSYYGMQYIVPVAKDWPATIIAVNLGGAIIPVLMSLYLLFKYRIIVQGTIAITLLAVLSHMLAHPVHGVGIALPIFVTPVASAIVAMALSWRYAAPLAYIAGSLGTLIGADLLNLGHIQGLGAPIASIGGAGTFDGVFLTGIIAVLLTVAPSASQNE